MPHEPIAHHVNLWNQIRERIAAEFDIDEDDETVIGTVDGETTLNERLGWLAEKAIADKHSAAAIKVRIEELEARTKRLTERADKTRALIAWAMQESGQRNITLPCVTMFTRAGREGFDVDETILSDDYRKTIVKLVTDKDAIQASIDEGQYPPGVTKKNPQPVLTIKGK